MKEIQNFIEERDELELRDLFAMSAMKERSRINGRMN